MSWSWDLRESMMTCCNEILLFIDNERHKIWEHVKDWVGWVSGENTMGSTIKWKPNPTQNFWIIKLMHAHTKDTNYDNFLGYSADVTIKGMRIYISRAIRNLLYMYRYTYG